MEFSPTSQFIDASNVAVPERDRAAVPYQTRQVEGWAEAQTGDLTGVSCTKLNEREFT